VFALVSSLLAVLSCRHSQVPLPAENAANAGPGSSARGEYIVRSVAVCGGCHAADQKNVDGPLSGGAEFSNWKLGTSRGSNLTSDRATGLGNWSEAEIVRALRNGVSRDGRLLSPVMPYAWYHEMSDEDAFAVARYLKSLPAVSHEVKQSPNLVFKLGKLFFIGPEPAMAVPSPRSGATAEYGAYLSLHVALCVDCHTPRGGLKSEPDRKRLYAGTNHPPQDFPENPANITPDPDTGIGKWSEADFVRTLRTGVTPDGGTLNRFMPWPELKRMSDDDLKAMYRYLRTVPPIRSEIQPASVTRK